MNKHWYLVSAFVGALATMFMASQHQLSWTIFGVASVGLNIYNYLHAEDKTEE